MVDTRPPADVAGSPSRRSVLTAGALGALGTAAFEGLISADTAMASTPTMGRVRPGSHRGAPAPSPVLGAATGDERLCTLLRPHLTGFRHVAAFVVDRAGARFAGFGADEHREFEIASVTKTFTGALLLDAVRRDEVRIDTTVADILGRRARRSQLARATLAQLVTHTAGLPRLDARTLRRSERAAAKALDPYRGVTSELLIEAALGATLTKPGTHAYSNLSFALLGQLLATAAGQPWEHLVSRRIARPLRLRDTWAPVTHDRLDADSPRGYTSTGQLAEAWTMEGYAPAGGIRSTAHDMRRYLSAMIDGRGPGALGPRALAMLPGGETIGAAWFTSPLPSRAPIIWHNGMSFGFSSFIGWRPDTGLAVVLLGDLGLGDDPARPRLTALGTAVLAGALRT